jgi:hypothetical protein
MDSSNNACRLELIRVASLQRMKDMMKIMKSGLKFGKRDGNDDDANRKDQVAAGFSSLSKDKDVTVPELSNDHFEYALAKTNITCKIICWP